MKHRLGAPMVAVLFVLFTSGCTNGADKPASGTPTSAQVGSVPAATHLLVSKEQPEYRLRNEETISGLLSTDDHGCVTVERDSETALLWAPVGSSLTNDGSAVTAPVLGDELEVGSTVTFEGEWTTVLTPAKAVRPTAWSTCVAEDEVMVAFISY